VRRNRLFAIQHFNTLLLGLSLNPFGMTVVVRTILPQSWLSGLDLNVFGLLAFAVESLLRRNHHRTASFG
jgi:hypothetical protein